MANLLFISVPFTTLYAVIWLCSFWWLYRQTWKQPQRWMEATRHNHRLAVRVGRWIWFKWIHFDSQYWILHVDFAGGPIEVQGLRSEGCYWDLTWNTWTETNRLVSSESVELNPDGACSVVFAKNCDDYSDVSNLIPVRQNAGLGVIFLRIQLHTGSLPARLPSVWQGGQLLTKGETL